MGGLSMLGQSFSVICEHGKQSPVDWKPRLQRTEESPQLAIYIRDFAVIGSLGILMIEGRWRFIRGMRIIDMNPDKKGYLIRLLREPIESLVHHNPGAPLWRIAAKLRAFHFVVIDLKSLMQAGCSGQHRRSNEGGSSPSPLLQHLCEDRMRTLEAKPTDAANLMDSRIGAGKHAGMRRRS